MKVFRVIILTVLPHLIVLQGRVLAAEGTSAAQLLEISPSARAAAMGGAFCGLADDVDSLHYNPAGLSNVRLTEIPFGSNQFLAGISYQFIAAAFSLRDVRSANIADLGAFAFGSGALNKGDFTARDTLGAANGAFAAKDTLLLFSYAKPIVQKEGFGRLSIGGTAKFFEEEVAAFKTNSQAFDTGLLWQPPRGRFSFGAALLNMGKKVRLAREEFSLPTALKVGAAFRGTDGRLTLAADVTNPAEGETGVSLGLEYWPLSAIALRGGYDSRTDFGGGLTAGVGLSVRELDVNFFFANELVVDYAFLPAGEGGNLHRFTVKLKLGIE